MQYNLLNTGDQTFITVFMPGESPLAANDDHPNFKAIIEKAIANDPSVVDLFDVSQTAAKYFLRVSERVSVSNGRVYFDGDEVDNSLTKQIVRFVDSDVEDYTPLVNYFEKVASNPNEHSRTQLYSFLEANDVTILQNGDFIGYKGVRSHGDHREDENEGVYYSTTQGRATVDGEVVNGYIPNPIGSVIEMPRNEVAHNPDEACSTGLHVATRSYASGYGRGGAILEVHVNPRDVVSVPHEVGSEKVRVCRYTVADVNEQEYSEPVRFWPLDDEDEDGCPDCCELYEDCYCDEDVCDDPFCPAC